MSFSSQLPPIPLAQASASLRALAQTAGQNLEAKVVAQLANGATQVQIGRQTLTLQFPQSPPVGATLNLAIRQTDGQVQVSLVGIKPPPAAVPPPGATPSSAAPATSVQLSPAALATTTGSASSVTRQTAQTAAPQPAASPASAPTFPPVNTAPTGSAAPVTTSVQPATGTTPPSPPVNVTTVPGASPTPAVASPQSVPQQAPLQTQTASSVPSGEPQTSAANVAGPAATAQTAGVRPVIPYAAAAPTQVAVPTVAAGNAATALPPVTATIAGGLVGQHAPPPNTASVPVSATPTAAAAPVTTAPQSPAAALTQMVQQALPRQDSIVGLTTALASVIGRAALPPEVVKAAQQVLGNRLSLDGGKLDGQTIQNAVRNSGIFQEAMLSSGAAKAAGGDLKTHLLGLQRQLGAWLGDQAPVEQLSSVPPPLKGLIPRARTAPLPLPDLPDDPEQLGKILLDRTEAALSRVRLHQNASLPEPGAQRHEAQWSLDIPVSLAGQQALLQMQIHRDPDGDDERPEERGWQVRFAINLGSVGEVGAQISMRGLVTGVLLWADDPATAEILSTAAGELRADLEAAGLKPGALVVRAGAPNAPTLPAASAGNLVDAVT